MHIILNNASMIPIYEQLMEQVKNEIITGKLKEMDPLPSVRALAAELRISALTVKKAYDRLEEDGFTVTIHGKGTYVAKADQNLAAEARIRAFEEELQQAVNKAILSGITREEIREIFSIVLEDIK